MDSLCIDFINSQWNNTHDPYYEPLEDEGWFLEFCEKWGIHTNVRLSADLSRQLVLFRAFLFNLIVDIDKNKNISDISLNELNRYLALIPLNQTLKRDGNEYRVILEPVRKADSNHTCRTAPESIHRDLGFIQFKISASLSELLSGKEAGRIRICDNPACRWVFLDSSKNQSRKWCSNTCSSLIKVRNFRGRRKTLREDTE